MTVITTRPRTCEACGREFSDGTYCPHCRQLIDDLLACETLRYWERRLVEAISHRLETGELPLPDGHVSSLFNLWDRRGQAPAAPSRPATLA